MQLVKLTAASKKSLQACGLAAALFLGQSAVFAQGNSPYSRYGLGDLSPNTNILNRGMGGISAGYSEQLSVNFNNPASYSGFSAILEQRSKKMLYGRVLLDVGINVENRTLRNPNQTANFSTTNSYFSYLQMGIPLRRNWGLSFGLRPLTRIGYKVGRNELLVNPETGMSIDSAYTEFSGNGGTYLPSVGTGFAIKNLSVGANVGYLFGRKEYTTKRSIMNDSLAYNSSNHTDATSLGGLFFNAGVQYKIKVGKETALRLGASGNIKQQINARRDIIRETIIRDPNNGDSKLDSVYSETDRPGEVTFPASFTYGFVLENVQQTGAGWMLGADLVQNKWSQYRFFGQQDSVQDNWQLRVGGQLRPKPGRSYFTNVAYRAGFFTGPDYIKLGRELPQYGITLGVGLPIPSSRMAPYQFTVINLGFEAMRRGNNDNTLRENLFRVSVGLSFSDAWFSKRKYD
ncbi:hypothetical protein [Paracnuella aquatica]|uniref:hypothetical protein n=1 Tax=Paracnuella aquatica TaxID=2268757 RepID=UPI000DEF0B7E|nr:hypothetical protein [Paracnuella aquatica]RPD50883.1 hypothetical protein DRJ53_05155 [Paracnuella aquatica]